MDNLSNAFSERRRHRRHRLSAYISVIDQLRNESIGQLVNLHEEGLMVIGKEMGQNAPHQITLMLPNSVNQLTRFDLGIECLWSQQADSELELYWSGCSIIDKSSMAAACIESLINIQS